MASTMAAGPAMGSSCLRMRLPEPTTNWAESAHATVHQAHLGGGSSPHKHLASGGERDGAAEHHTGARGAPAQALRTEQRENSCISSVCPCIAACESCRGSQQNLLEPNASRLSSLLEGLRTRHWRLAKSIEADILLMCSATRTGCQRVAAFSTLGFRKGEGERVFERH